MPELTGIWLGGEDARNYFLKQVSARRTEQDGEHLREG
jgi:hypothetical protein